MSMPFSTRRGWIILLPVLPLCLASLYTIQATGSADQPGSLAEETVKQLGFAVAGVVCMFVTVGIGYQRIGRLSYFAFGIGIILLACLVIDRWFDLPFVPMKRNTRRWIQIGGTQVQPSELMKVVYVLALAWYLRYRNNYRSFFGLIPPFTLTLLPMGLIKFQPDLGTLLLFLPVLFVVLYAAGAKGKHLVAIIALGLICSPLLDQDRAVPTTANHQRAASEQGDSRLPGPALAFQAGPGHPVGGLSSQGVFPGPLDARTGQLGERHRLPVDT